MECVRNLSELIARFISEMQTPAGWPKPTSGAAAADATGFGSSPESCNVLPSCSDFFLFYKKCLSQCAQLSTGS